MKKLMSIRLPIGISDFQKLIREEYQFVDKTHFIKEVINDSAEVMLIIRPRRFGKTLNMSMLQYFLDQSKSSPDNLFQGLEVAKDTEFCKKHQNQYPVIFISFKDIKYSDYTEAYEGISALLMELYRNHRYLLEGDFLHEDEKVVFTELLYQKANSANLKSAVKQLAVYMKKKFNKAPIILIDEYDTPIQEAYLSGYYREMIELMRSILGQALKDNFALAKAVLTGITRVSQESLFSGLNNVRVYSLLNEQYSQHFGFTEEEVVKLTTETGQAADLSTIKKWYNGYQIGKYTLYNPWSIINCLSNHGKIQPYWLNTASDALLHHLLSKAGIEVKQQLEELLQGKVIERPLSENLVFMDIETREEALWSLLLYAGYLNVISTELRGSRLVTKISIPNKEVSFVYDNIVEQWFSTAISLSSYDRFVQSLASADMDKFKMYLSTYIIQTGSYFDFNQNTPEQVFHMFILGLVVGLRDSDIIQSNQESGFGRYDVMFIPKNKQLSGILLEFKVAEVPEDLANKAQEALDQIKDKQYMEALFQHEVKSVLAIGMAFCGKKMEL
ncbi:MAG: ATP-binding protein, partial [Candidatus Midichloria sp.]|nr:ATP-binding protein [Candidatus Midichloria sp.]